MTEKFVQAPDNEGYLHIANHQKQALYDLQITEFTCLFFYKGSGSLHVNAQSYEMKANACYFLQPGMSVSMNPQAGASLQFSKLEFSVSSEVESFIEGMSIEIVLNNPSAFAQLMARLIHLPQQERDPVLKKIREQQLLYELLYYLVAETKRMMKDGITLAKEYIHSHYYEDITRENLALIAGLSPSYFSARFRKETGMRPVDYVNHIRIEKAKELLLSTNKRVRSIAKNVGYQDEFYFSRTFKKVTGVPPTLYIQKKCSRMLNLVCAFNGHFQALKYDPYASLSYSPLEGYRVDTKKASIRFYESKSVEEIFCSALQVFSDLRPEVIVCSDFPSEYETKLEKIAPTLNIPWMSQDWRQHLLHIATIVGKRKQAKIWLDNYDEKAEKVAAVVRQFIPLHDKVMILRIYAGQYRLYGKRNIGQVLYNDLGLTPIEAVKQIDAKENQRLVTRSELLSMKPDHVFIMTAADQQSQQLLMRLLEHEEWLEVPAVTKQQVYHIPETPWLEYSAFAHDQLLDKTMEVFKGNQMISSNCTNKIV
jgi:ABC-type Fe3+-hydroxamate transport system substrate-binding protein/AraC-like DNA-binding protein